MKRKILSLLLSFTLCLTLLPTAAFAEENEQSNKTSITTVDELLQFAKAVDNGEYDDKTDAVVSLDADLNLTDVTWKPIGSVFADDGTLLHYFSGKFYGNGHTISNLDFSKNYGKTEYPSFGFFSEVYGAEISGLTIQGKLDVSNSAEAEYVYFGTVAGVAANSKIFDCVSNVSFTNTEKNISGTAALCGYAINSTIEYCQNKGDFSTKDVTSFQMGGIVGLAQNSTVQYCANTGNMTSWASCTGGIVGQLYQDSKIINCYSTGKIAPLGKGTTDFGGIAGTVGAGTEIRHCYFAGEMDLFQYTATTPYKRLGGIAGGVSSNTPVFENNYFVGPENVPACFKYQNAGTEKTLDFMKTKDFFNEITAAGGNYRFNSNGTPILPAPKYAVSFVVTPAELANVVIKLDGQKVASPVDLEAGTYKVEVSADNCAVFTSDIKITADTATHTQAIAMTYLPVDYYDPTYPVTTPDKTENGTVTVSPRSAEKGDTVTITAKPDSGYQLDDLNMAAQDPQSRRWSLTINNPKDCGLDHDTIIEKLHLFHPRYFCLADEIGESGTYHTHIYLFSHSPIRFSTVKNRFPPAHIEKSMKGSAANRDYITKSGKWADTKKAETSVEGTFLEFGDIPTEAEEDSPSMYALMGCVEQGMTNAEIIRQKPSYAFRIKGIDEMRDTLQAERYMKENRAVQVFYLYGDSGTGKTRSIFASHRPEDICRITDYGGKNGTKFDAYHGQPVLVFEEFHSQIPIAAMLNYLDIYPLQLPARYHDRTACYTTVYITSNISLDEQYMEVQRSELETWRAFLRRIGCVKEFRKGKPPREVPIHDKRR